MKRFAAHTRIFAVAFLTLFLTACASSSGQRSPSPQDPWEGFNRGTYAFNRGLDKVLLKPLAQGYKAVTPDPLRQGINNALTNLRFPVTIINLLLQGKLKDSGIALGRFAFNSTFGLGGLVDVATREGIPNYNEDFGQTFAVWGWENSNYIMLPFFGPSTLRDGIGIVPELWTDGVSVIVSQTNEYWLLGLNIVNSRSNFLSREDALKDATDEYAFIRDAYLQRREFLIKDGENELPDYDDFLLDEEEDYGDSNVSNDSPEQYSKSSAIAINPRRP